MRNFLAVMLCVVCLGGGHLMPFAASTTVTPTPEPDSGLTPDQKLRAEALISLFDHDTTIIQYSYSEALGDGRGITAGRADFTTAGGDLLEVVSLYTEKVPVNPLARYLPTLKKLAESGSDDISQLARFGFAWTRAARDPVFRAVQDDVMDRRYYEPAMAHAADLGLKTALSKTVMYDTIIEHGDGDDPDGLPALIKETQDMLHGTPKNGIGEINWLYTFLKVRRKHLANPYNPDTRDIWKESIGRCDVLTGLVQSGNYELAGPITVTIYADTETVP